MKVGPEFRLIGQGVYSLAEASRLTEIPSRRIRRWIEGYSFGAVGKRHTSPPIVLGSLGRTAGPLALSFADLVEIRFLDAFLSLGVSWTSVRIAAERASELLGRSHPFSTRTFRTDGKHVLAEIEGDDGVRTLLNLVRDQWEMGRLVPMLHAGLDYDDTESPARWWPMSRRREVVLDPSRAFGAPIIDIAGVPTQILAQAAKANGSQRVAAEIFDLPVRSVRNAVEYERRLAA
jgi:uncharacterized protein (DUF433 family)